MTTAIADYNCRWEVGVIELEAELTSDYVAAWIEENQSFIEQLDAARERMYREVAAPAS